jgi:cyclopentanol dehydrogenase
VKRLQYKTAIVTGAAGGIGKAIAILFAREGAAVMATDIQEEILQQWVEEEVSASGLSINYMRHDVTQESDWKMVLQKTTDLYGQLNILVNNAGIFPGFADEEHTSLEQWNKVIGINLTGPFLGCKYCVPIIQKAGGGAIVNIASIAGLVGGNGPAYSASKGGLRLLSKDLAVELAKAKIRVNSICPGGVHTPMTDPLITQPGIEDMIRSMSPQGRMAEPEEIAEGALFLATEEASFVTGTDLIMDGGAVAR